MIKLGDTVKDSMTGFTGIAIGWAKYINGCVVFQVQDLENIEKAHWIDEQRLTDASKSKVGGPQAIPPALHP